MSEYRYQLERYRGCSTRYICPQCKRKHSFTRYIDTYNNNEYISDSVGKCNRIDKCGYHYTPKQYYTDNPWKRDSGWWLVGRKPCHFDQPTKTKLPQPPAAPPPLSPSVVVEGLLTRESTRDVRVDFWTLGHKHREKVQVSSVQSRRTLSTIHKKGGIQQHWTPPAL